MCTISGMNSEHVRFHVHCAFGLRLSNVESILCKVSWRIVKCFLSNRSIHYFCSLSFQWAKQTHALAHLSLLALLLFIARSHSYVSRWTFIAWESFIITDECLLSISRLNTLTTHKRVAWKFCELWKRMLSKLRVFFAILES